MRWVLIQYDWCPYMKIRKQIVSYNYVKTSWRHGENTAIYKPRREGSEETNLADTLVLDLKPSDSGKISFCLSHPGFGFAMAVLKNQCNYLKFLAYFLNFLLFLITFTLDVLFFHILFHFILFESWAHLYFGLFFPVGMVCHIGNGPVSPE